MKGKCTTIIIISMLLALGIISSLSLHFAKGQPGTRLPVILIHGYASDAEVWEGWEDRPDSDGILADAVTFQDDPRTVIDLRIYSDSPWILSS